VVQVRRLGTISRKIPQAASPLIHRRDDRRPRSHPLSRRSHSRAMPRRAKCRVGAEAAARAPNGSENGKKTRLNSI